MWLWIFWIIALLFGAGAVDVAWQLFENWGTLLHSQRAGGFFLVLFLLIVMVFLVVMLREIHREDREAGC